MLSLHRICCTLHLQSAQNSFSLTLPDRFLKRRRRQIKRCLSHRRVTCTSDASQTNLAMFLHDQHARKKKKNVFAVRAKPCTALRNRFYLVLGRLDRRVHRLLWVNIWYACLCVCHGSDANLSCEKTIKCCTRSHNETFNATTPLCFLRGRLCTLQHRAADVFRLSSLLYNTC